MSQCYNYEGNPTPCDSDLCIGTDCHGNEWYQDTFGSTGVYEDSTEGLWEFDTQEEFNEWFMSQYNWGEPFDMFGEEGDEVPHAISEEDALHLTTLFQQYNAWNEVVAQDNYRKDIQDAQEMYQLFEQNTEAALIEQELLADQGLELQIDSNFLRQEYEDEMAAIENKNFKLAIQDEIDQQDTLKASKGLSAYDQTTEDKLMAEEVLSAFDKYSRDKSDRKKNVDRQIDLLQSVHDHTSNLATANLERTLDTKELQKDVATEGLWRNTKDKIKGLREEYEVNIYQTLANMASAGAFLENAEMGPWNPIGDPVPDDSGSCTMHCNDECYYTYQCGPTEAVGMYYTSGDCCSFAEDLDEVNEDGTYLTAYCCPYTTGGGQCGGDCCFGYDEGYFGCWCALRDADGGFIELQKC